MVSMYRMAMAGIAFIVNTVALILFAAIGDKVFTPLMTWYYGFHWNITFFNPGIVTWIFPVFYGMLLVLWFVLLYCVVSMIIQKEAYPYQT